MDKIKVLQYSIELSGCNKKFFCGFLPEKDR